MKYKALSIVAPHGQNIKNGLKTLEIRSWYPTSFPLKDLMIVENRHYLYQDGDEDEGFAVALVDVETVHEWQKDEIQQACATYWSEGYFAWTLSNIRLIDPPIKTQAKRKIYLIEVDYP